MPLDLGRLRTLRLQKGWSQHELSLRIGVQGAPAVSAWERGLAVPRPSTLRRLAQVLGVDPVELLELEVRAALGFRELRVSRGLSLRDLAVAANVSATTVRRWERGDFKAMPSSATLRAVARGLEVSAAEVEQALDRTRRGFDRHA